MCHKHVVLMTPSTEIHYLLLFIYLFIYIIILFLHHSSCCFSELWNVVISETLLDFDPQGHHTSTLFPPAKVGWFLQYKPRKPTMHFLQVIAGYCRLMNQSKLVVVVNVTMNVVLWWTSNFSRVPVSAGISSGPQRISSYWKWSGIKISYNHIWGTIARSACISQTPGQTV